MDTPDCVDACSAGTIHQSSSDAPEESAESVTESEARANTCKVCLEAPCGVALVPCGHLAACLSCLSRMSWHTLEGEHALMPLRCPVCVTPIVDVLKIYS